MPYQRPTLTDLRDQVLQDIAAAQISNAQGTVLTGTLQRSILRVMAYAQAGMAFEHYGYLDWIAEQAVPWTATDEYLEGWANLKGVYRQAATPTQGQVTFSGTNGVVVPTQAIITRNDGLSFISAAGGTVASGTVILSVVAQTAGAVGNFDVNTAFVLQGVSGVNASSTASAQTVAGKDAEADTAFRSRMLLAYADPPQGGDRADYQEWALAVPGVTRAWVIPDGMGPGTVVVYFMMDSARAAQGGTPQGTNGVAAADPRDTSASGDQLAVANAIFPVQPVTALVYATAPIAQVVNFTVTNLGVKNTPAMQAAIAAALRDMFQRIGQVGGSIDPATGAEWTGIEPSDWYAALEAIPGLGEFAVASPSIPVAAAWGALMGLGTLTTSA